MLRLEMLGFMGNDPDVRYLPSGDTVVTFSLAHTDRWRDRESGQQKEHTEWVRFSAFGKKAEVIAEHCQKGTQLFVEGTPRTREWEQDGQKRRAMEVKLNKFEFCGKKPEGSSRPNQDQGPPPQDDFDDDIPF